MPRLRRTTVLSDPVRRNGKLRDLVHAQASPANRHIAHQEQSWARAEVETPSITKIKTETKRGPLLDCRLDRDTGIEGQFNQPLSAFPPDKTIISLLRRHCIPHERWAHAIFCGARPRLSIPCPAECLGGRKTTGTASTPSANIRAMVLINGPQELCHLFPGVGLAGV